MCHPASGLAAQRLALAGLITLHGLVDDIGAATAADHAAIFMARLEGADRIFNLHGPVPVPEQNKSGKCRPKRRGP